MILWLASFFSFFIFTPTGNAATLLTAPVSWRCKHFFTIFTLFLINYFWAPLFFRGVYRPLESCGTSKRAKFLNSGVCFPWVKQLFTNRAFYFFSRPVRSVMMVGGMFGPSHYFKVFYSIIRSVFIFMMNNFTRCKRSIQMLLHNISMFKSLFAKNIYLYVSIFSQRFILTFSPGHLFFSPSAVMRISPIHYGVNR